MKGQKENFSSGSNSFINEKLALHPEEIIIIKKYKFHTERVNALLQHFISLCFHLTFDFPLFFY